MIQQELLQDLTESYLKSLIAETSGAASSQFDSLAPFGELGIDSFYVLKIIRRLEGDFGTLPKSLLFEHFTISDLANYFVNNHEQVLATRFAGQLNGNNSKIHSNGHTPKLAEAAEHTIAKIKVPIKAQAVPPAKASPIRVRENEAHANAELQKIVQPLFDRYKRESSISRGTRTIAPNLFIGSARKGYFNYGRCKNIVMAYGYTGPEEYFPELLSELCSYCATNNFQLNIMGDRELPPVGELAFLATPFGVAQRIHNLKQFTLDGGAMRRLRYQVSKFEKSGVARTQEYRCGSDREIDRNIVTIIDRWCESRTKVNPLVHEVREEILAGTLAADHRLFLTYLDDVLQNAILITAMCSDENGYLMDLEFYTPEMPLGGLEFAITKIIDVLASEGCDVLSLGATYGCKLESSANADPEIDKILDDLRAQDIFNDTGNLQFKNKFRPENKPIFLCRPVGSGNPDDVIDIIMMIADPLKNQTPEAQYDIANSIENVAIPISHVDQIPAAPLAPGNQQNGAIVGNVRSQLLADVGFNPLNLPPEHVDFDLKTDSWSQLQMPSIEAQMKSLHAQLQQPVDVEESLRRVFPFTYFVLTESGQVSEDIFFRAWPKKGITLQNLLFPSTIFHQIDKDFSCHELPSPALFDLASSDLYKGNVDLKALHDRVAQNPDAIAMVCIEVGNNAAGGAPVSLKHLKEIKAIVSPHSIPLVMDATRVVENAQFLIDQDEDCSGKSIWSVVKELLSCADAVIGSLTKDFCVNKGGIIATNDSKLFHRLEALALEAGPGIDLIDRKLIALSLQNRKQVEARVLRRMENTRLIWHALREHRVPVVQPAGGHCVLIDVKQLAEFKGFKYPVASFLAWMYLNTGIRVAAHSVGMQKQTSVNDLVRLAVPVGMKRDDVDELIGRLIHLFAEKVNIPELALENGSQSLGAVHANYRLINYHQVTETFEQQKAETTSPEKAAEEIKNEVPASHTMPISRASSDESRAAVVESDKASANVPIEKDVSDHGSQNGRQHKVNEVAIVGMAGRYPKAKNVSELWENLSHGKDCIEEIPANRYEMRVKQGATKKYRGGFIDAVDKFDSLFFNISPREAAMLDPQERLFLEVAWEAIEDAGYYPEILSSDDGSRNVGVFVGAVWAMYQMLGAEEDQNGAKVPPNSFMWSVANRVSYWMNLSGPSLTLDTACSSSLTALYLACEAIQAGECSSAIVGGVNLDLHETKLDINSSGGALSKDGLCRSFGKGANGYVAGEGIGALFLKPLDQAIRDNDNIYGVIKSVAVNHGGRASGYTIPNPKAQSNLIQSALEKARIDARSLSYIEAHGTGTELGDPIEISGLTSAFKPYSVANQACAIGSIKSNIGHLEAAAGVVSVSKVLLQMRHKQLAPSLHSGQLNEFIDFANSPFYVVQRLEEWKGKEVDGVQSPLRAGISSFGAGGANAHVLLENYDHPVSDDSPDIDQNLIFPLSARTEDQLREMASRLASDISKHNLRLQDIAYTLQVGRKSFEYRVAISATTKKELLERLNSFLSGKKTDGVARGQVKNSETITRLLSRKEKEEFIQLLSQSRSAFELAELWVDGIFADWRGFGTHADCRRVSLPTYPFADKRHWAGKNSPARINAQTHAVVHPMVDTNESTFERQIFKKTFNERDFFIYDHHVADIPTLPGVAYLEFARKAGEIAAGRKVQKIKNIVWISPIAVQNATPKEVFIELKPADATARFEVFSYDKTGNKVPHSQGTLLYATKQEEAAEPEFIDLKAIRGRCAKVIEGKDAYPRFRSFGLGLGPSFQVLQEVHKNDTEILGILKLPDFRQQDLRTMILQPSLIDGSLQAGMGAHLGEQLGEMFVPFSIGEVEVLHPLQANCFSYATEMQGGNTTAARESTRLVKSDVMIVDETGKVLVKIRESVGVPLREIYKKNSDAEADGFAKLYYSYEWEKAPLTPANTPASTVPAIVLFDVDGKLCDQYRERLTKEGKNGDQVVFVQPGEDFQADSQLSYKVNPRNREDYVKLFQALIENKHPLENVCFAWNLHQHERTDDVALKTTLDRGVYSFLYVCQALIQQKLESKARLLFLYSSQDQPQPVNEAISGFIKALRVEYSKFNCKALEVHQETLSYDHILSAITTEFQNGVADASAVRHEYGRESEDRYIKKLRTFDFEKAASHVDSQAFGVKENGVYLITGGAGGLGLIFAEFLAKQHHAKVVLSGRSASSQELEAKLEELTNSGAEVVYLAADVAKREDVEKLIADTKARFGQINGVIHAAGVLRDSLIRNKKSEEMNAVFAPKIYGTLHLDEATKNENLDFFVMFSSVASVGGNAGQCDYSFANHYMDSFAAAREQQRANGSRTGKTLSLNWSLWADGGMKVDQQTELYFKKTLGIKPLSTDVGIDAFVRGLSLGLSQFAVVEGVQEKVELAWGLRKKEVPASQPHPAPSGQSSSAVAEGKDAELVAWLQKELSEIVMQFLKLDPSDVSVDKILLDLGFDSIGLTTFANTINEKYQLDITPVLFFDYPSLAEISKYLATERKSDLLKFYQGTAGETEAAATTPAPSSAITEPAASSKAETFKPGKGWNASSLDRDVQVPSASGGFSPELRFINQPIAIVGMSGIMPQSEDLDEFWDNLKNSKDMITVIPPDRWNWEDYYGDPLKGQNKSNSKWGGFMKEIDKFDPLFFGISPREAQMMDPQQRLFLETVWRAIEDSGQKVSELSGTKTGLFVGVANQDYVNVMNNLEVALDGYSASGNSHSVLANRISFLLNLRGPSAPIDTACSSSLVALHRAIESIHTGSSDMAIVGGVQIMLSPAGHISFGMAGMLSNDGKCKTFDKRANGYVRGEGCGAIFLKPLSVAEADGNHIYAVIRATAENHGGRVTTMTAPNSSAQAALLVEAYDKARIDATTVGYIECHGTGTSLGDPIEIQALTKAFSEMYKKHNHPQAQVPHCGLSSVKTNIGHLETAAGISSLLKVLLALKHKQIPANINFEEINPYINLKGTPFYIAERLTPWERVVAQDGSFVPRRAGVSSFGFGGANAHIVLEEYIAPERQSPASAGDPQLIVLSAKNEERLNAYVRSLQTFLDKDDANLLDLAYTLQVGRDEMLERVAVVVSSKEELKQKLDALVKGQSPEGCYRNNVRNAAKTQTTETSPGFIVELIKAKDIAKLAALWASGAKVDWPLLHKTSSPRRISAPTYPFARERCWIAGAEGKTFQVRRKESSGEMAKLHPLIHRNTSTLLAQKFSSEFTGKEFFLADHKAADQAILPAVAYIEMVSAAGELSGEQKVQFVKDMVWMAPLTVDDEPKDVEVSLTPVKNEVDFAVKTVHKGLATTHCRGKLGYEGTRSAPERVDIEQVQERCAETIAGSELYSFIHAAGLNLGKAFQVVQKVHTCSSECLAVLRLPEHLEAEAGQFWMHPVLLDGVVHTAVSMVKRHKEGIPWSIPYSVREVQINTSLKDVRFAHATWDLDSIKDEKSFIRLNISFLDQNGDVLVRMKDFVAKPIHQGAAKSSGKEEISGARKVAENVLVEPGLQTLTPVWNSVRVEQSAINVPANAKMLLLGNDAECLRWLQKSYPDSCLMQLPARASIGSVAQVLSEHSYDQLLWIAPDISHEIGRPNGRDAFIQQQEEGSITLFRIIKALLQTGHASKKVQWTIITNRTQRVMASDEIQPAHASVIGLVGSLAKEYPQWDLRMLDVDSLTSVSAQQCLSLPWDKQGNGLAYRHGEWFRQELALMPSVPQGPTVYRQNGVYVVIGGAGGVGEVWSRFMIKNFQAKLVWIGRREFNNEIQQKLDALAKIGHAPLYVAADATNAESLERALASIQRTYPEIHGVVHSAIVLNDQSIARMDESVFRSSLSAKVDVSVNMDRVFGGQQLDFMLFFSSIASFVRSPGQSNYSAGCTFKDSFAHQLQHVRPYPVKIMNWGYWGSVGVVADESHNELMRKMGIGSIEPGEGMAVLQALVNSGVDQVALIKTLNNQATAGLRLSEAVTYYPENRPAVLTAVQTTLGQRKPGRSIEVLERELPSVEMSTLATEIFAASLKSLGLFSNHVHTIADLKLEKPPARYYERWLASSIHYLQEQNVLSDDCSFSCEVRALADLWTEWDPRKTVWAANPNLQAQIALFEACLKALPGILSGKQRATDAIFPNSSMHLVEGIYRGNVLADHFNDALVGTLTACIEQQLAADDKATIRIVEIGAGTGGTTAKLLPALQRFAIEEYRYTDLSKAFLMYAEKHFKPQFPALTTSILDVSKALTTQAIDPGSYDVAIAANVLHATPNIRETLRNAKALLKHGGVLLLNEISTWSLFNHLTFGLLEGWWLSEDTALRFPGNPGLPTEKWRQVLEEEGFEAVFFPVLDAHKLGQQIVVAGSNGWVRQTLVKKAPELSAIAVKASAPMPVAVAVGTNRGDWNSTQSGDLPDQSRVDSVKRVLLEKLSAALKIDADRISHDAPVAEYGVDSIIGVDLIRTINETLQIDLETMALFEHSTVDQLARYIAGNWPSVFASQRPQTKASSQPVMTSEISHNDQPAIPPQRFQRVEVAARRDQQENQNVRGDEDRHSNNNDEAGFEPIAIIGMGGRFAGSESLEQFWENLEQGKSLIGKVSRWSEGDCVTAESAGGGYCSHGSFIDSIDLFDPAFFRIPAAEAVYMDPQQRLFLEESWKALEDAGYAGSSVSETRCGIYVGCGTSGYGTLLSGELPAHAFWGNSQSIIPARLAYHLNLQGPAIAVDTACSSSLVSVHLACQGLWSREMDMALAGGICLHTTPAFYHVANRAHMLSPDGECRSFDANANGFVPGEGVGVVVLKRLRDAMRDGDHIHGVIAGTGINQDGTSNGLIAPNARAQEKLERAVYERFKINPESIQVIEAHGTGTIVGDSIEWLAINRAFNEYTDKKQFCALGTVKTNIGHTGPASGVAGVLKLLLAMKHRQIPPSLHFKSSNPAIDLKSGAFYVNAELRDWKVEDSQLRRGAVSSFGFSGTNAHLIIEEPPVSEPMKASAPGYMVVLSARTAEQLRQQARNLAEHLKTIENISMNDLAYTLFAGRMHFSHRMACVAKSQAELVQMLEQWIGGGTANQVYTGEVPEGRIRENASLKKFGSYCIHECQNTADSATYVENLTAIAELYVKGYSLDYRSLFPTGSRRIPLPTYPFARERYWFATDTPVQPAVTVKINLPTRAQVVSDAETDQGTNTGTEIYWLFSSEPCPSNNGNAAQMVPMDAEEKIELFLKQETALQLRKPMETIAPNLTYFDLGLSSLAITTLVHRVNGLLNESLNPSALFEYRDIASLAAYLANTYRDKIDVLTAFRTIRCAPPSHAPMKEEAGASAATEASNVPVSDEVWWKEAPLDDDYEKVTF